MLQKIKRYLLTPHSKLIPWKISTISAIWVFALLFILRPFDLSTPKNPVLHILGFSLVTLVCCFLAIYLCNILFKHRYNRLNFIITSFIIILFITIGNMMLSSVYARIYYLTHNDYDLEYLFLNFLMTLFIGIPPISISYFLSDQRLAKQEIIDEKNMITLYGSTKDSVSICIDDLLYIEASGNYVKITHLENNLSEQKTLRAKLYDIENQLQMHENIIRCHRAFIVNLNKVEKMEGNMRTSSLILQNIDSEIPISRSYIKIIKNILATT